MGAMSPGGPHATSDARSFACIMKLDEGDDAAL
jgi:hypothetical protein